MGLTLSSIEQALRTLPDDKAATKADWRRLSSAWRTELNERIAYLERLRDQVTDCIGCGCLSLKSCPIYNLEDKLAKQGPGPVLLDSEEAQDQI